MLQAVFSNKNRLKLPVAIERMLKVGATLSRLKSSGNAQKCFKLGCSPLLEYEKSYITQLKHVNKNELCLKVFETDLLSKRNAGHLSLCNIFLTPLSNCASG